MPRPSTPVIVPNDVGRPPWPPITPLRPNPHHPCGSQDPNECGVLLKRVNTVPHSLNFRRSPRERYGQNVPFLRRGDPGRMVKRGRTARPGSDRALPRRAGQPPGRDDGFVPVVHLELSCRATTSPRPGRTRSPSSRSRSPTASPTSRPISPGAWTSTTSRPTFRSSSPTAWTPSTRSSAGSHGASGRWRCGRVRRLASRAAAEVPRPDVRAIAARAGDGLQRHPHHAAGAVRRLRQLQQPAHQRLQRGSDHPERDSVRRALAIQMIIDQEWGLAGNENPLQGSFILDQLTDLVEEAVLAEFDRSRTRRRPRRHGDRLPARQDPGRVDAVRAA